MYFRSRAQFIGVTLLLAGVFVGTGCDFQAAQDAFDEIGVVIELPPINTTVTAQIVDAGTLAPINQEVTLRFAGQDAGKIIDVYSDPLSEVKVRGGFFSFGLDNSLAPTEEAPATFDVVVTTSGYVQRRKTIQVFESGTGTFMVRLMNENTTRQIDGTAGQSTNVATSTGTTTSTTTVQTQRTSATQTSATFTIPPGTQAVTSNGTPLTGNWTVDMRYFDNSPASLQVLPEEAQTSTSGQSLMVVGAIALRIWNPQTGQVAGRLTTPGGRAAGKQAAECAGSSWDFTVDASTQNALNLLGLSTVDVFAVNGESGVKAKVGTADVVDGTALICYSTLDLTQIDPITGWFYVTVGLESQNRDAAATATVALNGHAAGQVRIRLVGPGISKERVKDIAAGSTTLSTNLANWAKGIPVVEGYQLVVVDPDGNASDPVSVNPFQGSYSLTLPAPVAARIDVTLNLEPNCPAGQRVPFTGTLSGLTVNFQRAGGQFRSMPTADITIETTSTAFVRAVGRMRSVLPNTQYTVYATLGTDNQQQVITTPSSAGSVTMDATELRKHCQ